MRLTLDLQAAVNVCFYLVGYGRLLHDAGPLPANLDPDDAAWASDRRLNEADLGG
jgi:hypothetical protein